MYALAIGKKKSPRFFVILVLQFFPISRFFPTGKLVTFPVSRREIEKPGNVHLYF